MKRTIINKMEDMKYGYLELGGYLKISKEIYFRDTIDIYNKRHILEVQNG